MANWVRYPLPPFLSVSTLESMRSGGAIPPLKRGISAIPARYPEKTRQKGAIPPSAILSRKGIARYGGVSRTGPLSRTTTKSRFGSPVTSACSTAASSIGYLKGFKFQEFVRYVLFPWKTPGDKSCVTCSAFMSSSRKIQVFWKMS